MPSIPKDDISRFHEYGLYIPNRVIYFGSEGYDDDECWESGVDYRSSRRLITNLICLDKIIKKVITIYWNSPGGDWEHGMAIYDVIRGLRSPVTMVGLGCVRSMGTIVMQACSRRILTANSSFMIHDGEDCYAGTPKSAQAQAKEGRRSMDTMYEIYLSAVKKKKPNMTKKKLSQICGSDRYFDPQEALEWGFIDEVTE